MDFDCIKMKSLIKDICYYNVKENNIIHTYKKDSNCYKAIDWYNKTCNNPISLDITNNSNSINKS